MRRRGTLAEHDNDVRPRLGFGAQCSVGVALNATTGAGASLEWRDEGDGCGMTVLHLVACCDAPMVDRCVWLVTTYGATERPVGTSCTQRRPVGVVDWNSERSSGACWSPAAPLTHSLVPSGLLRHMVPSPPPSDWPNSHLFIHRLAVLDYLIAEGVQLDAIDYMESTALHAAAALGDTPIVTCAPPSASQPPRF